MTSADNDILHEYLSESFEVSEKIGLMLAKLKNEEQGPDVLRTIARDVHTIKGSSQLFGFLQIGKIAHSMENCLEKLQVQSRQSSSNPIEILLEAIDVIIQLLKIVKATKNEPASSTEVEKIIEKLETFTLNADDTLTKATNPKTIAPVEEFINFSEYSPNEVVAVATVPQLDSFTVSSPTPSKPVPEDAQTDTIRVQVELLDNLMILVGELVLIRNQLDQTVASKEDEHLLRICQRLNVVASELQNDIMKTRMQPIGNVMTKFQRVVRNIAKDLGKRIDLELVGNETELDKTLIEAVRDPLMHLVRNSIDHGLEQPEDRVRVGKSPAGHLRIKAFHESGQVVIQVQDDGRGLDRAKIGAKAIQRGLATDEQIARLSDVDVFRFIFLPGFSTAEKVSNVSGRGVGMDVVKTNIERIGGTVDLNSVINGGTTITLKIPLTLAIISALIVRVGSERFAIPQVKLIELIRIPSKNVPGGIELLQDQLVYRLRGDLLPLVELGSVLSLRDIQQNSENEMHNVAIVRADNQTFGLIVDSIEDSADIVVKPLPNFLKDLGIYSGATIMGNGSVALTLDIAGIASIAGINEKNQTQVLKRESGTENTKLTDESTEYLIVDIGSPGKYAIPLCMVNRLEEFNHQKVEFTGSQEVIRYREGILPILIVNTALSLVKDAGHLPKSESEPIAIVVVKKAERFFGLRVNRIVDVLTTSAEIDLQATDRPGIIGAFIHENEVVTVIDVLYLIDKLAEKLYRGDKSIIGETKSGNTHQSRTKYKILLAEDSNFFRTHITQILKSAGYNVLATENGQAAYAAFSQQSKNEFQLVLSDIEMPIIGGLELARKIRTTGDTPRVPMIALSSRFSRDDINRSLEAGFDKHLEKLNAEDLLNEIDKVLKISEGKTNVA